MTRAEMRTDPAFLARQEEVRQAQLRLDQLLVLVTKEFPPDDGCGWGVSVAGTLMQIYTGGDSED